MPIDIDPQTSLFLSRMVLAACLGACLGIERDLSARPAGMRTSMVIAMSACLFTLLSIHAFTEGPRAGDPSRLAAQVITGVGFLGAGVLLKGDKSILGLTTAANIWLVAAIGITVGVGWWQIAIGATVFALVVLVALRPLSRKLDAIGERRAKAKGRITIIDE